jgi:alpha-1,2-mannosyltransferase
LALTLAVALGELTRRSRGGTPLLRAVAAVACGGVVLTLVATRLTHGYGEPIPRQRFREAVASSRCVVADEPGTLAVLDVLSRDLARGCPVPVDLTGITYDRDAEARPDGEPVSRTHNPAWQRDLRAYLASGQTLVLTRRGGTGMGPQLEQLVRRLPVVASGDGLQVKAVKALPRS